MSDQERLEIGQTFGRYQIVRMLGEGGMGVVYEALHLGLKKRFAVKTLRPSVARIPEAQTRFLREGEAASRIHHPHVVNVVDVGTEGGIPFLVMEFLEGLSLAELLDAGGRMEVERSVSLLLPSAANVDEALVLSADDPRAVNSVQDPDRVKPTPLPVHADGRDRWRIDLPPHSMATIRFS